MSRRREQEGQATVILVISLLVLLGMGALVLDVGSWFQAHRQTQSAADAAALAAAHALPEDATGAQTLANQYLAKNGGGTATVTVGTGLFANDTVRVVLTRETPGFFAKVFGVSTVHVTAKASARSGYPAEARWAAPFAVDEAHPMLQCRPLPCFGEETRLELDKVGPGAYRVLNIDDSHGGSGPKTLEDWITRGWEGYMPLEWYFSDPGAKFNSDSVRDALDARLGGELLFPVYRTTRESGANFEYEIVGFVGFVMTGYHVQGSKLSWLEGSFSRVIWEGLLNTTAGGADFGVRSIQLVE